MNAIFWLMGMAATLFLGAGSAHAQEQRLIFATLNPPTADMVVQVLHPWAQTINDRGSGILSLDVRDGFALANFDNVYSRVTDHVVQVAFGLQSAIGGRFPLSEVADLPFISDRSEDASVALWRLYKNGTLSAEYKDIVPLMFVVFPQISLHLTKAPRAPDDPMAGLRINAPGRLAIDMVTRLGGSPLSLPVSEVYEGLQRNTMDGLVIAWTAFQPFRLAEVTRYHVDSKLGTSVGMVFMARSTYDALPAVARDLLDKNSGEAWSRRFGAAMDQSERASRDGVKAMKNQTIVALPDDIARKWQEKSLPVIDNWTKSRPGGEQVLAAFRKALAEAKSTDHDH